MSFDLIIVDARKARNGDVMIYEHNNMGKLIARFPSLHSDKPDYRYKYLTLNCAKYRINWIK